jgi:hypothetical protein
MLSQLVNIASCWLEHVISIKLQVPFQQPEELKLETTLNYSNISPDC